MHVVHDVYIEHYVVGYYCWHFVVLVVNGFGDAHGIFHMYDWLLQCKHVSITCQVSDVNQLASFLACSCIVQHVHVCKYKTHFMDEQGCRDGSETRCSYGNKGSTDDVRTCAQAINIHLHVPYNFTLIIIACAVYHSVGR